jgi:hypothetical protein
MARNRDELATRAQQLAAGLHTWKITDHLYLAKSRRFAPGTHHEVHVSHGRVVLCAHCPGFASHGTCAHAAAVERRLAREKRGKAPSAAAVRDTEPILRTTHGARQLYRDG